MNIAHQLDTFHKTRPGYMVFELVDLGLSYLFASLAINSGSLWQWFLALILFIGFLQNFVKVITRVIHGNKRQTS